MQELKLALDREQPKINAEIERAVSQLPQGVQPIAKHVLSAGGKRLRPFLTVTMGRALGVMDNGLYTLGAAIELLHAATLLHDDILDNALLRRGKPAAHTVYESTGVVLAGDAMLAKAMLMVSGFGDTRLTDCISEAVMRTAEGEIEEFAHLRDPDLSQADYLNIIIGKTAWMLRASCELGALYSGVAPSQVLAAATFGLEIGIAFQIVDDALDFLSGTGKPRGGDIKEGKVTPPLLSYISSLTDDKAVEFKSQFANASLSEEDAERICDAVFAGGHTEKARNTAQSHLDSAAAILESFNESEERIVLQQMLMYILNRST